jgi:GntR family transcriptional regulator
MRRHLELGMSAKPGGIEVIARCFMPAGYANPPSHVRGFYGLRGQGVPWVPIVIRMNFKTDELRWQAMVNEIRHRIANGAYRPGTPVPGELRLAVELGVSKGTARRALNTLLADGTLYSVLGKGTFVSQFDGE